MSSIHPLKNHKDLDINFAPISYAAPAGQRMPARPPPEEVNQQEPSVAVQQIRPALFQTGYQNSFGYC